MSFMRLRTSGLTHFCGPGTYSYIEPITDAKIYIFTIYLSSIYLPTYQSRIGNILSIYPFQM